MLILDDPRHPLTHPSRLSEGDDLRAGILADIETKQSVVRLLEMLILIV